MKYRRLGRTNKDISVVSLGCMRFPDEEAALAVVKRSVELGINYLETSLGYCGGRSEVWVGRALKELGGVTYNCERRGECVRAAPELPRGETGIADTPLADTVISMFVPEFQLTCTCAPTASWTWPTRTRHTAKRTSPGRYSAGR